MMSSWRAIQTAMRTFAVNAGVATISVLLFLEKVRRHTSLLFSGTPFLILTILTAVGLVVLQVFRRMSAEQVVQIMLIASAVNVFLAYVVWHLLKPLYKGFYLQLRAGSLNYFVCGGFGFAASFEVERHQAVFQVVCQSFRDSGRAGFLVFLPLSCARRERLGAMAYRVDLRPGEIAIVRQAVAIPRSLQGATVRVKIAAAEYLRGPEGTELVQPWDGNLIANHAPYWELKSQETPLNDFHQGKLPMVAPVSWHVRLPKNVDDTVEPDQPVRVFTIWTMGDPPLELDGART